MTARNSTIARIDRPGQATRPLGDGPASLSCSRELPNAERTHPAAGAHPAPGSHRRVHPVLEFPVEGRSAGDSSLCRHSSATWRSTSIFTRSATTIRSKSTCSTIVTHSSIFSKFYYPELPQRRAFFLAQGSQRVVYTYASPRLGEDLRHEATHALLRGTYGDLPLWLDEGLAEYFETDLTKPGALSERIAPIADRPEERLAARTCRGWNRFSDIREMTPRDYRESWAWVHLLLNGSKPGRSVLLTALADLHEKPGKLGLTEKGATNALLLAHLNALELEPTRAVTADQDHTVRLQDQGCRART